MIFRSLGRSSKQVAARLKILGIRGRKKHTEFCPLGIYLRKCGFYRADVGPRTVSIKLAPGLLRQTIELPQQIRGFVSQMDKGEYPELQKESRRRQGLLSGTANFSCGRRSTRRHGNEETVRSKAQAPPQTTFSKQKPPRSSSPKRFGRDDWPCGR